jgi:hypothetical protein
LRTCLYAILWACADRNEIRAVVVFFEAVFEAVFAVTCRAVDTLSADVIYKRFARGIGALLVGEDAGFGSEFVVALPCGFGSSSRVFAFFGAFVGVFGAVVEAEFPGVLLA